MTINNIQKIPPSDELISQLRETGYNNDGRTYHRLVKQINWTLASAEQEEWYYPNFIDLDGFLNRIRFAVDPTSNLFFFGELG